MPRVRKPRPTEIICASCPAPILVGKRGRLPTICASCRRLTGARTLLHIATTQATGQEDAALLLAKEADAASKRLKRRAGVL